MKDLLPERPALEPGHDGAAVEASKPLDKKDASEDSALTGVGGVNGPASLVKQRLARPRRKKILVKATENRKTAKAFFEVYDRECKGAITWDTFLEIDQAVIKFLGERDWCSLWDAVHDGRSVFSTLTLESQIKYVGFRGDRLTASDKAFLKTFHGLNRD